MDYEQKYKDALERAKGDYTAYKTVGDIAGMDALESIFPELAESEDGRMLRELNDYLCEEIEERSNDIRDEKDSKTLNMLCYVLKIVDACLERQKVQKPAELNIPKWKKASEELHAEEWKDNFFIKQSNTNLYRANDVHKGELYLKASEVEELLENLPHLSNYIPKPAEWSEEDEKMIKSLVDNFTHYAFTPDGTDARDIIPWLKSLRPQPKRNCKECAMFLCGECTRPHWKPSEEQMDELKKASEEMCGYNAFDVPRYPKLKSLYEQLKKLM